MIHWCLIRSGTSRLAGSTGRRSSAKGYPQLPQEPLNALQRKNGWCPHLALECGQRRFGFGLECGDSFAAFVFGVFQINKDKPKNKSGEGIAALQTKTKNKSGEGIAALQTKTKAALRAALQSQSRTPPKNGPKSCWIRPPDGQQVAKRTDHEKNTEPRVIRSRNPSISMAGIAGFRNSVRGKCALREGLGENTRIDLSRGQARQREEG